MPSLDFSKEKKAFRDFYDQNYELFKDAASSFATLLLLLLTDNDDFETPNVIYRVKDREECIKKFERKYLKRLEEERKEYEIKDYITDIIGLRVICYYETDIDAIYKILSDNLRVIDLTNKIEKLEEKDDVFGYKALHLNLALDDERKKLPEYKRFSDLNFEVQIRTIVQDAWSVLDHKIKYKKNIPHQLKRRINRMAALFELADQEFINIKNETIKFEEEIKQQKSSSMTISSSRNIHVPTPLDAFTFLKIAQDKFPDYEFYGYKIDGFVDELKEVDPNITEDILRKALDNASEILEDYKLYQYNTFYNHLNPYTIFRHALYLMDKEKYKGLLFEMQRKNFDEWLTKRST